MSRIINPDSAGKERTRLTKSIVLSIRELAKQTSPGDEARDQAAFICLALKRIADTIDVSVAAWEKRGYWVKADRFRMEWDWAGQLSEKIHRALIDEDWGSVAMVAAQIGQKLGKVNVPLHNRLGTPWTGAWQELKRK